MRAVLDTNVVMSAIFFGGVPFDVLSTWHNGEFELVVSDAVMEEYREIAARMKAKFPSIEPERWRCSSLPRSFWVRRFSAARTAV